MPTDDELRHKDSGSSDSTNLRSVGRGEENEENEESKSQVGQLLAAPRQRVTSVVKASWRSVGMNAVQGQEEPLPREGDGSTRKRR